MTRKELVSLRERDKEFVSELLTCDSPHVILGALKSIALEPRYYHHERGQRVWSLFTALEEAGYFDHGE